MVVDSRGSNYQGEGAGFVALKIFLVLITFEVIGLSLYEEDSLNYVLMKSGGLAGQLSLVVLGLINVCNCLDIAMNLGATNRRIILPRWKSETWLLTAFTYLGYCFVLATQGRGYWLMGLFCTYAAGCIFVAVNETFQSRYRQSY